MLPNCEAFRNLLPNYDDTLSFFVVGMLAFFIIGGLLAYGYDLVVKLFRNGSK